ncbi:ground-like domain protein [Ancylostoma caninum]|uniref:Ground-like domain protein n=1 Tax=Ancylostoma caninum TaxID=29170 RepID=A0A368GUB6_ANCCA|nr:ground-like domain protein [Ancylostoma caninum]
MRLLAIAFILLPIVSSFLFPSGGGGGGCCCQPQPQCCCPPPQPCCCGGGGGFGKRKKREIGHVRGGVEKRPGIESDHGHCNSVEISELMRKHIANSTTPSAVKSAIYQELVALYPDESFTVLCVDGAVSYQADSHRYCVEGNMDHNCYVFMHIANSTTPSAVKSAIYQELVALYPDESFTVLCVDGAVSYQADSHRYCVEGNMDHNCYVFMV